MLHLYKAQFYFPFSLERGTFNKLNNSKNKTGKTDFRGEWFERTPPITPHNPETFAEYQYFHPHARGLLFGEGENGNPCLMLFEVNEKKIEDWTISLDWSSRKGDPKKPPTVKLDWVAAYFYDLDVGTLVFGVSYRAADNCLNFDDVLDINNLLRRSGPGFVDKSASKDLANAPKGAGELPTFIRINDADGKSVKGREEDFGVDFDNYVTKDRNAKPEKNKPYPYIGKHFTFWLECLFKDLEMGSQGQDINTDLQEGIFNPILDERNFVCSYVVTDKQDSKFELHPWEPCCFKTGGKSNPLGELRSESEEFRKRLYQYIFVDPSTTEYNDNPQFRDNCLESTLYLRFRNQGSYYGFSRYSGMYLLNSPNSFTLEIMPDHFNTMYFQMANLLIGQRAILLNLSDRAARLSKKVPSPDKLDNKELNKELEGLLADFLKFHNKYWFSEVTGQEQGIEIFDLWSRNMGNKRLFDEVEKEIKALHDFSNATVGRRLGFIAYLNIAMLGLAGPALIASIFGMNIDVVMGDCGIWCQWVIGVLSIVLMVAIVLGLIWGGKDIIDWISRLIACRDKCKKDE